MAKMYRQGDVLLVQTEQTGDEQAPADPRGVVLAEGESSGHYHAVVGGAKLFRFRDATRAERVLHVADAGATLQVIGGGGGVPRHTPFEIPVGKYIVRVQRQWTADDEMRSRAVED